MKKIEKEHADNIKKNEVRLIHLEKKKSELEKMLSNKIPEGSPSNLDDEPSMNFYTDNNQQTLALL